MHKRFYDGCLYYSENSSLKSGEEFHCILTITVYVYIVEWQFTPELNIGNCIHIKLGSYVVDGKTGRSKTI